MGEVGGENLDELLLGDPAGWLAALPTDQRKPVESLLSANPEPLVVATKWLKALPGEKRLFGALGRRPLVDSVVNGIRVLLCGDPRYKEERKRAPLEKPRLAGGLL